MLSDWHKVHTQNLARQKCAGADLSQTGWISLSSTPTFIGLMFGSSNNTMVGIFIPKKSKNSSNWGSPHPESTFPSTSLVFDIQIIIHYHSLAFAGWLMHPSSHSLASTVFLQILPAFLLVGEEEVMQGRGKASS